MKVPQINEQENDIQLCIQKQTRCKSATLSQSDENEVENNKDQMKSNFLIQEKTQQEKGFGTGRTLSNLNE